MNGRERGMAVRTGINKQGWESSQFPVACQKCYGQNPYMRMLKQNFGQQCRICFRPFTVFKWKGDRGIYKRTCLCNACSKQKNLCQVCTLDLQFGLPLDVRDKRCGVNGKLLLNDNFVNQNSKKIKPPPPSTAPPLPKNVYEQKEAVYIPQKQESQSEAENRSIQKAQTLQKQVTQRSEQNYEKIQCSTQRQEQDSIQKNQNSENPAKQSEYPAKQSEYPAEQSEYPAEQSEYNKQEQEIKN